MSPQNEAAVIVIDSGFDQSSIAAVASRVMAICDLSKSEATFATGSPVAADVLSDFAGDPLNHGSVVLSKLAALLPDTPFILIRAFADDNRLARTVWSHDGKISAPGWTEAYRWAVQHCRALGLASVANCSFGGCVHAMDGTGWEAFQLGHEVGSGKAGHIVVAAAGPGDGRSSHASWLNLLREAVSVNVHQRQDTQYNFWESLPTANACASGGWNLEVHRNGEFVFSLSSQNVSPNLWNGRRQQTFLVGGAGLVSLTLTRLPGDTACGDCTCAQRFDCWVTSDGSASFLDHVDPVLVAEPAVFEQVIAVGLRTGSYGPNQAQSGVKPDVLLPGGGPISFRAPELTAAIAMLLRNGHDDLDVDGIKVLLGKFPDLVTSTASGSRV